MTRKAANHPTPLVVAIEVSPLFHVITRGTRDEILDARGVETVVLRPCDRCGGIAEDIVGAPGAPDRKTLCPSCLARAVNIENKGKK